MLAAPSSTVTHSPLSTSGRVSPSTRRLKKVSITPMVSEAGSVRGPGPRLVSRGLGHVRQLHRGCARIGLGAEPCLVQGGQIAFVFELAEASIDLARQRSVLGKHDRVLLTARYTLNY